MTAVAQVNGQAFVLGVVQDTTQQATSAAQRSAVSADRVARSAISRAKSWGGDYPTLLGIAALALALLALFARRSIRKAGGEPAQVAPAATAGEQAPSRAAEVESRPEHLPVR